MTKKSIYSVIKQIKEKPLKCEMCGKYENIHNVFLKYDNGKVMCDECYFKYYNDLEKRSK